MHFSNGREVNHWATAGDCGALLWQQPSVNYALLYSCLEQPPPTMTLAVATRLALVNGASAPVTQAEA